MTPSFVEALAGRTVALHDLGESLTHLREAQVPVRSMVVLPVPAGNEVFGVLSLGTSCRYEFSMVELRAYESIATGVGVAIANYRNSQQLAAQVGEYTEAALAITAVEVTRAARHEARGALDNAQFALRNLSHAARVAGAPLEEEIDGLRQDLDNLVTILDKLKLATAPRRQLLEQVGVFDVFSEARLAVAGRLRELQIDVSWAQSNLMVEAYHDNLRHVFLNLLLNSMDAFSELRGKKRRRIEVILEAPTGSRPTSITLIYRDNATGIESTDCRYLMAYPRPELRNRYSSLG